MSLNQFEDEGTTNANANATAASPTPAPAGAPAAQTTAVAVKQAGGVALAMTNPAGGLKDAFPLEWNSLPRVLATNGSFYFKDEGNKAIGDEIVLDLVTIQDHWMLAPGDDRAEAKQYLRYSTDGVTATDGTDLKEHLKNLQELGYTRAAITQRLVIAGELVSTNKDQTRVGELVMIDLPPTGRGSFSSYTIQAAHAVSRGRKTVEEARRVKVRAVPAVSKQNKNYTQTVFSLN